jgi:SAM-dependent methyltransferase
MRVAGNQLTGSASPPIVSASLREVRTAVSYRRLLLDAHLSWAAPLMRGQVVDLGGKRERRRGRFMPVESPGTQWTFVNIDAATAPDLLCDVTRVPLPDGKTDCVLCTEVLEHLPDPQACVREAHRLLREQGRLIASVPFLYPVHPDPGDYQRFAPDGLRLLFGAFAEVDILSMGGDLGTIGLLAEVSARHLRSAPLPMRLLGRMVFEAARLLEYVDLRRGHASRRSALPCLTTGYFVVATK